MGGYTSVVESCIGNCVVICLQISNFEWVDTPAVQQAVFGAKVVICLQISNFEWVDTPGKGNLVTDMLLWFAYKLVTLNGWIHLNAMMYPPRIGCDLLTN